MAESIEQGLFADKAVIITGGARSDILQGGTAQSIGEATAQAFLEEGALVTLLDINGEAAEATAIALKEEGERQGRDFRVEVFTGDVTSEDDMQAVIDESAEQHGSLRAMVACAAIFRSGLLADMPYADHMNTMEVKYGGSLLALQYGADAMLRDAVSQGQPRGAIVLFSSIYARRAPGVLTSYAAANAAVDSLVKTEGNALGPSGIRVVGVAPGAVEPTPGVLKEFARAYPEDPQKVLGRSQQKYEHETPLGRLATPQEVARAAVWLASDQASFINATTITVDGGWTPHF